MKFLCFAATPVWLLTSGLMTFENAQDEECPGINATTHKANPYYFTYESWVKKATKGDLFIFGRCVQTKNNVDMYVDWKGTFVKGFAQPKWPCLHELPAPTDDSKVVETDLWFGAAPNKIKAPYKEVKKTDKNEKAPLNSRIKMSVPKVVVKDPAKPGELRKIDIAFQSSVAKEQEKYRYTYTWNSNVNRTSGPTIKMRFQSATLRKLLYADSKSGELMDVAIEPQSVKLLVSTEPTYEVTVIEFMDISGRSAVGTAPVAIYHPKMAK